MSSSFSRWIQIALALFATVILVKAESGRPQSVGDGGLQMSVNTGAYRVYAGDPSVDKVRPRNARAVAKTVKTRDALLVSVHLANRSPYDLAFTFPDESAAQKRFSFRLFNSEGEEVWSGGSSALNAAEEGVTATLRKRSKWSTVVQIPLKVDEVWLTPGVYTVEASLAGEPKIGATTLFEIAVPPKPDPDPELPKNTGIKGQVLQDHGRYVRTDGLIMAPTALPYGVKATILVQQIMPEGSGDIPFTWQGETTADGRFEVNTPPGKFRVQATAKEASAGLGATGTAVSETSLTVTNPFPPIPPSKTATAVTTVKAGAFSSVNLMFSGGITFEPPRADTGIKGQVFLPTAANEMVVASGAKVVVEELREDSVGVLFQRPRFVWTGTTDAEGRFQVNTLPGRFRVAASWTEPSGAEVQVEAQPLPVQINLPLRASKEVQVINKQISDVRLDLKPGLVEIGTRLISSVGSVEIRYLPTFAPPTMVEVSAQGMVNTGGWSNPQLRQRRVTPEGIIEFDFVAKPPEGIATQAFESIEATTRVPQPLNFRGVRVFAQINSRGASSE